MDVLPTKAGWYGCAHNFAGLKLCTHVYNCSSLVGFTIEQSGIRLCAHLSIPSAVGMILKIIDVLPTKAGWYGCAHNFCLSRYYSYLCNYMDLQRQPWLRLKLMTFLMHSTVQIMTIHTCVSQPTALCNNWSMSSLFPGIPDFDSSFDRILNTFVRTNVRTFESASLFCNQACSDCKSDSFVRTIRYGSGMSCTGF